MSANSAETNLARARGGVSGGDGGANARGNRSRTNNIILTEAGATVFSHGGRVAGGHGGGEGVRAPACPTLSDHGRDGVQISVVGISAAAI